MDKPETVTHHRWDGSCLLLHLLDVELGLLGWRHQHRALRVEHRRLFHGEHSAEAQSKNVYKTFPFLINCNYVHRTWKHTSVSQALLPHPRQHCRWRWSHYLSGAPCASRCDLLSLLSPSSQAPSSPEPLQSSCPCPEVRFWGAQSLRRDPSWPSPPEIRSRSRGFSPPLHRVLRIKAPGPFHYWLDLCPDQSSEHLLQRRLPSSSLQTERGRERSLYRSCCHRLRKHDRERCMRLNQTHKTCKSTGCSLGIKSKPNELNIKINYLSQRKSTQ